MPVPAKDMVYIESDIETAVKIFANRFGFNPLEEKCACCGMSYIPHEEYYTLAGATADERGCAFAYDPNTGELEEEPARRYDGSLCEYFTLDEYLGESDIAVIYEQHISESDLEEFDWEMEGDQNFYDLNKEWDR